MPLTPLRVKKDSRVFHVGDVPGLESLPAFLEGQSKPFVLLLAMDAFHLSDDLILHSAKQVVAMGLCYLCAWGPDCERVHDLFDREIIPFEAVTKKPLQKLIMTTWHERDSLREAIWFFQNCAWPAESKGPQDIEWVAISVNNLLWTKKISHTLVGCPTSRF